MGYLRESTGGYAGGLLVLAAALVIQAAIVVTLRVAPETVGRGFAVDGGPEGPPYCPIADTRQQ